MDADLGIYAQDRWTLGRLTLSYGLRLDYLRASVPAQNLEATRFIPARNATWRVWSACRAGRT
jgi:hypothetical protein